MSRKSKITLLLISMSYETNLCTQKHVYIHAGAYTTTSHGDIEIKSNVIFDIGDIESRGTALKSFAYDPAQSFTMEIITIGTPFAEMRVLLVVLVNVSNKVFRKDFNHCQRAKNIPTFS